MMRLALVLALPALALATAAHAQDDDRPLLNRWESGLDVKYATIADQATPLLSAQWYRRFATGTRLGLTLSALPTSVDRKEDDGSKTKANTFYGGLAVEQVLWEDAPYRISVGVAAGQGQLYLRNEGHGREDVFEKPGFNFVEPAVYGYVYNYRHLDLGVMAAYRIVKMSDKDEEVAEASDVGGASFGVTFRHQI